MEEARGGGVEQLSPRIHSYPRDLLRRFASSNPSYESPAAEEQSGEIELSLGLSLGGCFGVDPMEKRGLLRSSSIASLPFLKREQDPAVMPVIARTCSLPVEIEEEQKKRKELQSLRRLEAKRKRSEKRNSNSRSGANRGAKEEEEEENCGCDEDMQQGGEGPTRGGKVEVEQLRGCPVFPGSGGPLGAASNGATVVDSHVLGRVGGRLARAMDRMRCFGPTSQASIGSQGISSSGVYDFESWPPMQQGFDKPGSGYPSSIQPSPPNLTTDQKAAIGRAASSAGKPVDSARAEVERNVMDEMPCVSTRGDGPNGRRIEGFLYKYGKGEEVRIVCVCHGSFLSPAEFVKHAGGGDVAHPLRHIVVNPSPSNFL